MKLSKPARAILISPLRTPVIRLIKWQTFPRKKADMESAIEYFEGNNISPERKNLIKMKRELEKKLRMKEEQEKNI